MKPILKVGTSPLPFVQVGMQVQRNVFPKSYGYIVDDMREDASGLTVVRLSPISRQAIPVTLPSATVRAEFTLLADFDPNLPDDAA